MIIVLCGPYENFWTHILYSNLFFYFKIKNTNAFNVYGIRVKIVVLKQNINKFTRIEKKNKHHIHLKSSEKIVGS